MFCGEPAHFIFSKLDKKNSCHWPREDGVEFELLPEDGSHLAPDGPAAHALVAGGDGEGHPLLQHAVLILHLAAVIPGVSQLHGRDFQARDRER